MKRQKKGVVENKCAHQKRGDRGAELMKGDHGDQTQQEEAEANQSAPRGGEAVTERGERRRDDTQKYR